MVLCSHIKQAADVHLLCVYECVYMCMCICCVCMCTSVRSDLYNPYVLLQLGGEEEEEEEEKSNIPHFTILNGF